MRNETLKILSIQERHKYRYKFGGTKDFIVEEVSISWSRNRNFQLHYLQSGFQKHLKYCLFMAYENIEWCRFAIHIGSPSLTSFIACCFVLYLRETNISIFVSHLRFFVFYMPWKSLQKEINNNKEGDSEKEKCYSKLVTVERHRHAGTLDFDLGFVGQNNTDFNFIFCYYRLFSKIFRNLT